MHGEGGGEGGRWTIAGAGDRKRIEEGEEENRGGWRIRGEGRVGEKRRGGR